MKNKNLIEARGSQKEKVKGEKDTKIRCRGPQN